jgi:hypothetical protein
VPLELPGVGEGDLTVAGKEGDIGEGEAKEGLRLVDAEEGGGEVEVEAAVGQREGSISGTGSFA